MLTTTKPRHSGQARPVIPAACLEDMAPHDRHNLARGIREDYGDITEKNAGTAITALAAVEQAQYREILRLRKIIGYKDRIVEVLVANAKQEMEAI